MNTVDDLVAGYLTRLEDQSRVLPADRRSELLAEIREHISDARAAGAAADEAAVRTLLDRLGTPGEIVAAAQEDVPAAPPAQRPRGTGMELAAVLLLTAGSFIPFLGWTAGVVLLWLSSLWRVREKLLGTLVVPFGPGAALFVGALLPVRTQTCVAEGSAVSPYDPGLAQETVTCTTSGLPVWAGVPLGLVVLIAPFVVAVVLFRIARRRAAAGA